MERGFYQAKAVSIGDLSDRCPLGWRRRRGFTHRLWGPL